MTNEPTEAMKEAGVKELEGFEGSYKKCVCAIYAKMKSLDPDFTRSAAVQSSDVERVIKASENVLAAMDDYNEKHGTFIGGTPFFELGRSIAALRNSPPTNDGETM